jgi:AcrR family transcriptional regulator
VTRLRLVAADEPWPEPGDGGLALPGRLSPGRHGLPADLVKANQRERLLAASEAALAEQGYGRVTAVRIGELAGVSSRTFYEHFDDLWSCLSNAYEAGAERLEEAIETACAASDGDGEVRARAGIAATLSFLAGEPALARLLSAEPPPQANAIVAARRKLAERLLVMLRRVRDPDGAAPLPGLERRLIGGAVSLVAARVASGNADRVPELEAELNELLLAPLRTTR